MLSQPTAPLIPQQSTLVDRPAPSDMAIALVAANWSKVRVGNAEITPCHEPDGGRAVVHARVHLGELLPPDVEVDLIRQHEPMPAARADRALARLWSGHSYHNDSYDFEASVPADELREGGHLAIRVTPASQLALSSVLAPVTIPVAVPGAS